MKKRIFSMLLAIVMVVGLVPTHVLAADCTHDTMTWDGTLDYLDHKLACQTCEEYAWQPHYDGGGGDGKCDVCQLTIDANNQCVHDGKGEWDGETLDDVEHWMTCTRCGGYWENHYDGNDDGKCDACHISIDENNECAHTDANNDSYCDVCDSCVHSSGTAWDGKTLDDVDHWMTCDICDGYWEAHYDNDNNNLCDVCSYGMSGTSSGGGEDDSEEVTTYTVAGAKSTGDAGIFEAVWDPAKIGNDLQWNASTNRYEITYTVGSDDIGEYMFKIVKNHAWGGETGEKTFVVSEVGSTVLITFDGTTAQAIVTSSGSSSGGGEAYTVTIGEDITNGTITADKSTAAAGETVTLTIAPASGYQLVNIKINSDDEDDSVIGKTQVTFTMPAEDVLISARFDEGIAVYFDNSESKWTNVLFFNGEEYYRQGRDLGNDLYGFIVPADTIGRFTNYMASMPDSAHPEGIFRTEDITLEAGETYRYVGYNIDLHAGFGGTLTADVTKASKGQTVTLTVTPNAGFSLENLTVMQGETPVAVTENSDGTYSFTMPAGDVTVNATFKAAETDPVASVTVGDTTTDYTDITSAVEAAQGSSGSTLKLQDNITVGSSGVYINGGDFTIDLNGFSITSDRCVLQIYKSNITLTDTSEAQTGGLFVKIEGEPNETTEYAAIVVDGYGGDTKVTIKKGTYSSDISGGGAISIFYGDVTIHGGTFYGSVSANYQATMDIHGGTFIVRNGSASNVYSGTESTVTIDGGSFFGTANAISNAAGTLTVKGDVVVSGNSDEGYADICYFGGTIDLSGWNKAEGATIQNYADGITVSDSTIKLPADLSLLLNSTGKVATTLEAYQTYTVGKLPITQSVKVSAVEFVTEEALAGAILQIIDSKGTVVEEWVSTTEVHEITDLKTGEVYTLRATVAPEGYIIPSDIQFSINDDGKVIINDSEIEDSVLLVEFAKTKVGISTVEFGDEEALAGASMQLIDSNGEVVEAWVSTTAVHEITGLQTGEVYTLRAAVAPDGYTIPADTTFSINTDGTLRTTDSMNADSVLLVEFDLTVVKISAVDVANGEALAGATMQIIDASGDTVDNWVSAEDDESTTDIDESVHTVLGLKTSVTYTLCVTAAPNGYTIPANMTFSIDANGTLRTFGRVTEDGVLLAEFAGAVAITEDMITVDLVAYTGARQIPDDNIIVRYNGMKLTLNEDYYIQTSDAYNYTDAGNHPVGIIGMGSYTGAVEMTFTIEKAPIGVYTVPTVSSIWYGQTLADSTITGGQVDSNVPGGETNIAGTWTWNDRFIMPYDSGEYPATFTPDNANYQSFVWNLPMQLNQTTPDMKITAAPEKPLPNDEVTVTVTVTNPYNTALTNVPAVEVYYQIGNGGLQKVTDGKFTIPDETPKGTVVRIIAQTLQSTQYMSKTEEITITTDAPEITSVTFNSDSPAYEASTNTFTIDEAHPLIITVTGENLLGAKAWFAAANAQKEIMAYISAPFEDAASGSSTIDLDTYRGILKSMKYQGYQTENIAYIAARLKFSDLSVNDLIPLNVVERTYDVELPTVDGGNVTTNKENPVKGDEVTITVTPDEGKEVVDVTVKDASGNEIAVTENEDGTYTYEQPAGDVEIIVILKAKTYTVTLVTNSGIIRDGDVTEYTYGVGAKLPGNVTRSGYSFGGWYDNEACTGIAIAEINTTDIGDKTFYAKWTYTGGGGGGGGYVSTYAITVEDAKNGDVTVSHKSTYKGATVTVTVKPDTGYTLETLTVTDKNGKEIELTNKGDGKYTFKMPASKVTVTATFMDDNTMLNFFVDVPADAYYYDAVLWAVKEGITNGTSATTFSPDNPCTRAQMATFLWRAAGSPEPVSETCIFTDVSADAYYAKAVQWAYEQKITNGTTATTFSPDKPCTRAQMATFLCRAAKGEPVSDTVVFADVQADKYYAKSVQWAYEQKITNGTTATTFSPDNPCTRAQMVTFLYRYFVK